eukprot:TRINITY_DN44229_c0_g1_i1.p1 TRINITY_DN44229_c0_g1~~TRINITY_DN44229_c0_g1_i1.p1  ORF type:complete len:401 (+),score=66.34 TRINITY_DN44229_c0_g1_i1:80-1282(+)
MLVNAVLQHANVELSLSDGRSVAVPGVYLRDSCQCAECWHPHTLQRTVDHVDPNIAPAQASIDGNKLHLHWRDGHKSTFSSEWLAMRVFPKVLVADEKPTGWTAAWMHENIDELTFDFEMVAKGGASTLAWLRGLRKYGLTRLRGAARQRGELKRLSEALGVALRRTNYNEDGGETFHVLVKPNANNQAYTDAALPLHTDLPFYGRPPSVQLLHCITQSGSDGVDGPSENGASLFSDGLQAAERISKADRELLTGQNVVFEDIDPSEPSAYHYQAEHPVLVDDKEKGMVVHINNGVRSTLSALTHLGAEKMRAHYAAIENFRQQIVAEQFAQRASEGDVWVFDNRRVLHGRTKLVTAAGSGRELEGAYMEWDDLDSRYRLEAKLDQAGTSRGGVATQSRL